MEMVAMDMKVRENFSLIFRHFRNVFSQREINE